MDISLQFTFEPAEPEYAAISYNIYAGNTKMFTGEAADVTDVDGDGVGELALTFVGPAMLPGTYPVTMSVNQQDGNESPRSNAIDLTIPEPKAEQTAPVLVSLTVADE